MQTSESSANCEPSSHAKQSPEELYILQFGCFSMQTPESSANWNPSKHAVQSPDDS